MTKPQSKKRLTLRGLSILVVVSAGLLVFIFSPIGRGMRESMSASGRRASSSSEGRLAGDTAIPGDSVFLSPTVRAVPGEIATPWLLYRHPGARDVRLAGDWGQWQNRHPLRSLKQGRFACDISSLSLSMGRHEYKFIVDGEWEAGANREFYINARGLLEQPSEAILSARIETDRRIDVVLRQHMAEADVRGIRFVPELDIQSVIWHAGQSNTRLLGCNVAGDLVSFEFHESVYGLTLEPDEQVVVAGDFNGWRSDGVDGGRWRLRDEDNDGVWTLETHLDQVQLRAGTHPYVFKFVVNGEHWCAPSILAPNATPDGKGNQNLRIDPSLSAMQTVSLETLEPVPLHQQMLVIFDMVNGDTLYRELTPGAVLDSMHSDQALGAVWSEDRSAVTLNLFAPRAARVLAGVSDMPQLRGAGHQPVEPARIIDMDAIGGGVWSTTLTNSPAGSYYAYSVEGPMGAGEGFSAGHWFADPYSRAVAHAENCTVLIDPLAGSRWFKGWTDQSYVAPAWEDILIYETHVRHLTKHASSAVPAHLRGTFEGILHTEGTGTGLDHLKSMGVNMIEFLPVQEFENGTNAHDWGYATAFFFAPEASYGRDPLNGSQYFEFKHLVNALHGLGFGVIMDVVYNHIGSPNVFSLTDRKYFFRQDHEFRLSNFSGCGNDVKTEAPLMRRLIVDNIRYWVEEFHVDGFRFDLAELIDMETLMAIRDDVRRTHPNVLLISEPWSSRGSHKDKLTGTGWAAWNNDFRDVVKEFAQGYGDRESVKRAIRGSVDGFAATPMQSINYLESHDDRSLADDLTENPGHDGRRITLKDAARNRIAATVLFTSLGIPMIAEGQAFLRSKRGIRNTFDKGDVINALDWNERDRPLAAQAMRYYAGLAALRSSDAGRSLRWREEVPGDYFEWFEPAGQKQVLGYGININGTYPGAGFIVILNTSASDAHLSVPFTQGQWTLVGDGVSVSPEGIRSIPGLEDSARVLKIKVPAYTALIFMRKTAATPRAQVFDIRNSDGQRGPLAL